MSVSIMIGIIYGRNFKNVMNKVWKEWDGCAIVMFSYFISTLCVSLIIYTYSDNDQ